MQDEAAKLGADAVINVQGENGKSFKVRKDFDI